MAVLRLGLLQIDGLIGILSYMWKTLRELQEKDLVKMFYSSHATFSKITEVILNPLTHMGVGKRRY